MGNVTDYNMKEKWNYFSDGKTTIDFVLAYDDDDLRTRGAVSQTERLIFEVNLRNAGLRLEYERDKSVMFIKLNAPQDVLEAHCETLRLRMRVSSAYARTIARRNTSERRKGEFRTYLTAPFSRDKLYLFDVHEDDFFPPRLRSTIVYHIISETRFSINKNDMFGFGIKKLIEDGVYTAAYPLHDSDLKDPHGMRYMLYKKWASLSNIVRAQPLNHIQDYFGPKIAFYFAWRQFYIYMLTPIAILGTICNLIGLLLMNSNYSFLRDICNSSNNFVMCPVCNDLCGFYYLKDHCFLAKITFLVDNPIVIAYALLASLWCAICQKLWQKQSDRHMFNWHMVGLWIRKDNYRTEYLNRASTYAKRVAAKNQVTWMNLEIPFWRLRFPRLLVSCCATLLFCVIVAILFLALSKFRKSIIWERQTYVVIRLLVTIESAVLSAIMILFLEMIYPKLTSILTRIEELKSQESFERSYILKLFIFEFVTCYIEPFYLTFFKGKFTTFPGEEVSFLNLPDEKCELWTCIVDISILILCILGLKKILLLVMFALRPKMQQIRMYRSVGRTTTEVPESRNTRWRSDYQLLEWPDSRVFPNFMPLITEFGYVIIFAAAFPLSPLFALAWNLVDLRITAKKYLMHYRRPVSFGAKGIGEWNKLLDFVGKVAIFTNAYIVAFNTNLIPSIIYKQEKHRKDMEGFLEFALSYILISDVSSSEDASSESVCRYFHYREPPWSRNKYELTETYWLILFGRLLFVIVYENVVLFLTNSITWLSPDVSSETEVKLSREDFLTNEIILAQERLKEGRRGTEDLETEDETD